MSEKLFQSQDSQVDLNVRILPRIDRKKSNYKNVMSHRNKFQITNIIEEKIFKLKQSLHFFLFSF